MPPEASPPAWHAMRQEAVYAALETDGDGLEIQEASQRRKTYGSNQLPAPPQANPLSRFLAQFNNTLIYFLLSAGAAAAFLGHIVDGMVIVAVVIINAVVGFVQEGKAEKALDAIRDMIAPLATVLREGKRHVVDARDIVAGDVVLLQAGDKVPADIRLTRARDLLVDEAILTGSPSRRKRKKLRFLQMRCSAIAVPCCIPARWLPPGKPRVLQ